ncbi:uncharacterized mitochondrial protein AtMg00810-like [Cornus florida]|uniref:uncharacterized mitochondrial protein AtMg00810-like n=1 Tax=Cornus florida TaxID=4283 RepID=UPI00289C5900|nr:uncharacterized mitochondrial protein AtMg00810-like [Cornus florida]
MTNRLEGPPSYIPIDENLDYSSGKTIGNAKVIDGLYYFEDNISSNKKAQGLSSFRSIPVREQIMLWAFTSNISHLFVPRNIQEALDDPNWRSAVLEEINALKRSGTWEIIDLPKEKKTVGCDDIEELTRLKKKLTEDFEVKDLGALKYFLGMEFARSREGIFVNQRKYVLDLLNETGLLGCKAADTPIEVNLKLEAVKPESVVDRERYQRLEHFEAVYRILRYLKGSLDGGRMFKKQGHLQVEVYADANWAGSTVDR